METFLQKDCLIVGYCQFHIIFSPIPPMLAISEFDHIWICRATIAPARVPHEISMANDHNIQDGLLTLTYFLKSVIYYLRAWITIWKGTDVVWRIWQPELPTVPILLESYSTLRNSAFTRVGMLFCTTVQPWLILLMVLDLWRAKVVLVENHGKYWTDCSNKFIS